MGTSARFRAAAVVAALLTAGFAADLLSRAGGRRTVLWVDDVGTFAAAVCATVACAVAAWRGDRRDRRGWALLCAGLAFWAFGEAAWGVYELSTGRVPFPSVADAGYLLAVPAVASALLLFPASGRLTARTRALLDGLVVAGALFMVSWVAVLGGVYRSGSGGAVDQAITLAYPIGDVVTGTMVLTVLATRRWRWRNPLVLVGLGLAIMAVSDSAYAWYTQTKTYSTGNPLDIGYVAAYLLLALAALRPEPTSPPEHRADGEWRHADRSPLGGSSSPTRPCRSLSRRGLRQRSPGVATTWSCWALGGR